MVKTYELGSVDLDKWLYQNGIKENDLEYVDVIEGCLVDNYLISCKNGLAMLKEHYLNSWTSDYILSFARYGDKEAVDKVWNAWDEFQEFYENQE